MECKNKGNAYKFPIQLDRYILVDLIGVGGMGEVFLAEDPVCARKVALKRILPKRKDKESARKRFKKEVQIAAQLSHPSIMPIYDLIDNGNSLYYTMPYLERKNLQKILIDAKKGGDFDFAQKKIGGSIPSLMLVFLNICQATEHTHEKGFLHRDLKPENIMIGKYNEVTILDWGLATEIYPIDGDLEGYKGGSYSQGATNPRRTTGTIEYMAPERAFAYPASVQSDVYSLGVILYFMLTLELPYKRPRTIKEWRQVLRKNGPELPKNPQDVAPYREITQQLSKITLKCLDPFIGNRYQTVSEMIADLEKYVQGNPEWILTHQFDIDHRENWKFQESVILIKQMAISHYTRVMEWVLLMLSKESYSGNIQIQASVTIRENSCGIGFMMCVPTNIEGEVLEKGYLIWIGSHQQLGVKLLRDNVEVRRIDHIGLQPHQTYKINVEKQDNTVRLLIDGEIKISYVSHVPIVGGHFGLVSKDTEFHISPIDLSIGSQNVLVNCLSIPDAFLLSENYDRALMEYRRIAHSFKGRPEGREATFRAGLALIEQGKTNPTKQKAFFTQALNEFESLNKTSGAPIEYLGKSLVYQAENNLEEEIKCLELAVRKFPKHPLRYLLDEHILFRLHQTAQKDRMGAYAFTLLTLFHIPCICNLAETDRLTQNLIISWECLPFIQEPKSFSCDGEKYLFIMILLAFWLARPGTIYELIHKISPSFKHRSILLENGLLALLELGYPKLIDFIIRIKYPRGLETESDSIKTLYKTLIGQASFTEKLHIIQDQGKDPILYFLCNQYLTLEKRAEILPHLGKFKQFEELCIWALLLAGEKEESRKLLENKPTQKTNSFYFLLKGCYLATTEGEEVAHAHFESIIETNFPQSPTLLAYFLKKEITLESFWFRQAFFWEKIQLFKQLTLYYCCLGKLEQATYYEGMIKKEFLKYQVPLNFV